MLYEVITQGINRDDEFQCVLNFVLTVHEDDNLYDVLTQLSNQIANHPATMVPAFDRKKALCVIFKLISSGNELIRIPALKIFGFYLCRSTQKRKNESINQKNLFHLLTEKLLLNCRSLTIATYNALFEILVEQICPEILFVKHEDPPLESTRFENHQLLKVTAQLLCQSEECAELIRVKCVFLRDVIRICEASRENRRTVLQLSVWQEWLISLAYIYPDNEQQKEVTELVYELFSILLFHAIRLEYGGWRVWVRFELSELEINDTTQQDLDIFDAARFLTFFAELSDVFVFASGVSLNELEQEKNMPSGGILRQTLRLVSTVTVRNILACIVHKEEIYNKNSPKFDAIRKFVSCGSSKSITDFDRLLQSVDLQRLKGVIYRDMEETKQAQFLALAVVYFLSVLMVSRYRDILEPPSQTPSPSIANNPNGSPTEDEHNEPSSSADDPQQILRRNGVECNGGNNEENDGKISTKKATSEDGTAAEICLGRKNDGEIAEGANGGEGGGGGGIAAIRCENSAEEVTIENKYGPAHLENFNAPDMRRNSAENTGERRQYLTTKLQKALESVMPLFREILSDFRSFLQKTLLGTHGQEIMNDVKVLQTLKNGSVVEIVMLLCSQEWQTSLQKHAGLAFIELVNEGRLMAHATRDHILRVANEADFILNRLRAEDVGKHAQFESESNEQLMGRKAEELLAEQLLTSSKHREFVLASRALEKIGNVLTHPHGPWSSPDQKKVFWKLDVWEDDSRRRRRFVQNPWGKRHILATIQRTFEQQKTFETNQEQFLKDLSHKMITASGGQTKGLVHEFMDEADIEKWLKNESDLSEPIEELTTFSTPGKLIAPGLVIPGTISLTENDLFFDADEEHAIYKQQNPSLVDEN
uniref:BEACH-type PH domain-containing protein n=1 Tax=Globodera pallida TaxID=36090 RepID=A0A183CMQ5_GLOPA